MLGCVARATKAALRLWVAAVAMKTRVAGGSCQEHRGINRQFQRVLFITFWSGAERKGEVHLFHSHIDNEPLWLDSLNMVYHCISNRFKKAGVDTGERKRGGHALRMTLARTLTLKTAFLQSEKPKI